MYSFKTENRLWKYLLTNSSVAKNNFVASNFLSTCCFDLVLFQHQAQVNGHCKSTFMKTHINAYQIELQ